ncbi:MAG: glycosyltransferase family 2 protein [Elusimicrobiota bacterium]
MISVVCPVYNEKDNIKKTFDNLLAFIKTPIEVLVIYDTEDDNTIEETKRISAEYPFVIRLIKNKFGKGVLNAIRTGFEEAKEEAVLVIMADLSDDLSIVDRMYELIKNNDYDIVCGSRYMRGGRQIGGPLFKKTLSRVAGISLRYLTGIPTHDVTNSFKMYKKSLLGEINIESQGGFEIGMEIVVKAFLIGKKITEVPSVWKDRTSGKSNFKLWKWMPSYLKWYFLAFKKFFK